MPLLKWYLEEGELTLPRNVFEGVIASVLFFFFPPPEALKAETLREISFTIFTRKNGTLLGKKKEIS